MLASFQVAVVAVLIATLPGGLVSASLDTQGERGVIHDSGGGAEHEIPSQGAPDSWEQDSWEQEVGCRSGLLRQPTGWAGVEVSRSLPRQLSSRERAVLYRPPIVWG